MEIAKFDLSRLPIVVITVLDKEPTEASFNEFLKEMSKTVNNAVGKIVMITDLTNAKFLSADLRIKMGNWFKDNEAIIKERVEGMSIVNKSAIINIVIKGVFLIKKPSVPTEIFSTMELAMKWAEEKTGVLS